MPTKKLTTYLLAADNRGLGGKTLKRATGNWVSGDQFWNRQAEMELFIERLVEGSHLLLTAPRRIGKTSLLKEASRRLEGRFLCLFVDLQKAETPSDAIVELSLAALKYQSIWNRVVSVFQNTLKEVETVKLKDLSITLRGGLNADNWRSKGDEILQVLAEQEQPVTVFFDEVAILVNRMLRGSDYIITSQRRDDVDAFLSWLRANSIRHQGRIRFVVTGSIGLEPLVQQVGLSATLNTFTPFYLTAWSRDTAAGCLQALARGYGMTLPEEALDQMLDRLGVFIPHHVQMFFDHVYQEARLEGHTEVSPELVSRVYEHSMLGIRGHVELSHMEERLKMVLGPKLDLLALDLLTEAAVTGTLTSDSAKILAQEHFPDEWGHPLRDILGILEHDGYLRNKDNSYSFVSNLLKDWWRARFKFAYVPAVERGQ